MVSRLDRLVEVRDIVRLRLDEDDGKHTAPMAKVLLELEREIAELGRSVSKGSVIDDLSARRKSRGDGPSGESAAVGGRPK